MNTILPGAYRGTIDIDITRNKLIVLADRPTFNVTPVKRTLNRHYNNGLSKYLKGLRLSIVTDVQECRKIWQQWSPNENLFDLWDVRMAFNNSYGGKPYFMTLTKNSQVLACLPLLYQPAAKKYTWFGSDWMENTSFFTTDPYFIPILLYFAPKPLILEGINHHSAQLLPKFLPIKHNESNFFLDLQQFDGMDQYLGSLSKKKRYNFKRDFRRISLLDPQVVFNNQDHFKDMITITKRRFHEKGQTTDIEGDPYIEGAFHNLLNTSSTQFEVKLQSVMIGDRIAAVDMLAFHNGTMYPLRGGNDVGHFSGIGNFINYLEIQQAFEQGFAKVDFLEYAYGWKQKYLSSTPRYSIELKE